MSTQTTQTCLQEPTVTIGESFPYEKRHALGIYGLVPPRVLPVELQEKRILAEFDAETDPLKRFMILSDLYDRNVHLYYFIVCRNFSKLAPFIYTPHVGTYCLKFHEIYKPKRALYYPIPDAGKCDEITNAWPLPKVDIVVVTDGGRILGLGDLGANGIGIPIGKLALYCAAAGSDPRHVLPVQIDAGTNNVALRENPLYLGLNKARVGGEPYFKFVEEVILSIHKRWPDALIQFEDFGIENAFELLVRWRERLLCFNDDIQGTGAVTLSALINACRARGGSFKDLAKERIVICGAGSAGIGIANAIVAGLVQEGVSEADARRAFYLLDVHGLLGVGTPGLSPQQVPFCRADMPHGLALPAVVSAVKPSVLIGVSGASGLFSEAVVRTMAASCARPIIFPMSNPTVKSECTIQQVLDWTDGRGIFASGSPFPDATKTLPDGREVTVRGNQCNNMYVFPALGLAASKIRARTISDGLFYRASVALAEQVSDDEVRQGLLFPPLSKIRAVSLRIAKAVALAAVEEGLVAEVPWGHEEDAGAWLERQVYKPEEMFRQ